MHVAIEAVLSLYVSRRKTGFVLDFGDGVSRTMPIFEGYALRHASLPWDLAGPGLTEYLMKILTERGNSFTTTAERMIVVMSKEKLCYIAFLYDTELESTAESSDKSLTYNLPDEHIITVGAKRFRFTSAVPASFISNEASGILDTSPKCDFDIRKNLYVDVVLSSGTTLFPEIGERMTKELT